MRSALFVGAALALTGGLGIQAHPPYVSARAAIVMDARNGAILYERNAFLQMDPASTTKIMTALLVIEHGHLDKTVTVSRRADRTPGSSLHIWANHQYTRLDLLRGMLLRSGNDASVALAESDAGSIERFVAEMNVKAQQLGAFNTAYENTHGLTRPGHYSSAYDLAVISRAALAMPLFRDIVKSRQLTITELTRHQSRTVSNTNQLLYGFPGADGVKTGTTDAAGKCLVASATRDHRQLIAVVLKSGDRWGDAARLLSWGFIHWQSVQAVQAGAVVTSRPVAEGNPAFIGLVTHRPLWVDIPAGGTYQTRVTVESQLSAPVSTRRRLGFVTIMVTGQPPERAGLYASGRVRAKHPVSRFWRWLAAHRR